jgi:hypothetical protein
VRRNGREIRRGARSDCGIVLLRDQATDLGGLISVAGCSWELGSRNAIPGSVLVDARAGDWKFGSARRCGDVAGSALIDVVSQLGVAMSSRTIQPLRAIYRGRGMTRGRGLAIRVPRNVTAVGRAACHGEAGPFEKRGKIGAWRPTERRHAKS